MRSTLHILIIVSLFSAIVSHAKGLGSRDCPASDLISSKTEIGNSHAVPASIESTAQPALVTLVTLGGLGKGKELTFSRMGVGTGFALKTSQDSTSWLSVFHVTGGIVNGDKLLVFLPDEPPISMNSNGVSGTVNYDVIVRHTTQVNPEAYSFNRQNQYVSGKGFDFSLIEDRGINFKPGQRSVVHPLELRDLEQKPLLLNERIYLAGIQFGKMRVIVCSNTGFDRDAFEKYNAITIAFSCPEIKVLADGSVPLGAISGGAVLDSDGKAFGIFTGYSYSPRNTTRIHFGATPIFKHPDETLQPFPALKSQNGRKIRCLPCYSHVSGPDRYLNDPEKGKSSCAITYDESKRKFSFLTR